MTYNFDKIIDRRGSGSMKWEFQHQHMGYTSPYPMWVADTDFQVSPEIVQALVNTAQHPLTLGYTERLPNYLQSVQHWFKHRYQWHIDADWIETTFGVILTIGYLIDQLSQEGDEVIIQPPVYNNFASVITAHKRCVVENNLLLHEGDYLMNYDELERLITPKTKILILCNPHNPIGKSWQRHELERLVAICQQHGIFIISDEAHADLSFHPHCCLGAITDYASIAVCTSCGKGFNLSGLKIANIIIPDADIKQQLFATHKIHGLDNYNPFALAACMAAYNDGENWLNQCVSYIAENHLFLRDYLHQFIPQMVPYPSNAGFLSWIDCHAFQLNDTELKQLVKRAGLALSVGSKYGQEWHGFIRMNIGCSRRYLEQALNHLTTHLQKEGLL